MTALNMASTHVKSFQNKTTDSGLDMEYLSPKEVAERFNIPATSLSKWRSLRKH